MSLIQNHHHQPQYITLSEFLLFFSNKKPTSITEYINNARVKVANNLTPLKKYIDEHTDKKTGIRDIQPLYNHIINREQYLTRFYNTSLRVVEIPPQPQLASALNNNSQPQMKNRIRNIFLKEILCDTKSGLANIPTFLDVLFDLYQYPDSIIDYKLITPSAIEYAKNGRIGSVFSSFYFRASIMNPALVHNVRIHFFPNAKRVLTPTMGWGSYLDGFSHMARLDHYVGIDVIDSVCSKSQTSLIDCRPCEIDIYKCPSEMIAIRHPEFVCKYKDYFDAVFFSPPYYKMELYESPDQSTTNYKSYDEWLSKYWEKTVELCKICINPHGGIFSYIVSPFDNYNLPADLQKIAIKYFRLLHVVPIYNKNVNSTKHREPDDRLFVFVSENS